MRLPFLQIESDLLAHGAAEVAALAGCSMPQAVGHIAMLRAWAVSMADDSAPPDGRVEGEAAGRRIEAAAQWLGERGRLLQALIDARHVAEEEGGLRVRYLEPYAKAWSQNLQSKKRMRSLRDRSANIGEHGGTDGERSTKFDGQTQTQTQTQTQKEEDLPLPSSAGPEDFRLEPKATTRRDKKPAPGKPTDSRHAPLVKALVAVCQETTGRPYRFNRGHDARAVSELLESADQDARTRGEAAPAEIVRRWRIGLGWRWGNGEAPVQDLPSLNRRWQSCASTETAPPAGRSGRREDPNAGISQADPSACAACGASDAADYGGTRLCYGSQVLGAEPGCAQLWQDAVESGEWKPEDVAEWARRRMAT